MQKNAILFLKKIPLHFTYLHHCVSVLVMSYKFQYFAFFLPIVNAGLKTIHIHN